MTESAEERKRHTAYLKCTVGIQYTGKHAERLLTNAYRLRVMERIEWFLEISRQDRNFDVDDFNAAWIDVTDTTKV